MRLVLIALALCLFASMAIGQQQTGQQQAEQQQLMNGWFRFAHAFPEGMPVDVYLDNLPTPLWNWVTFRHVANYIPLLTGQHSITLVRSNTTQLGQQGQEGQQQEVQQAQQVRQQQTAQQETGQQQQPGQEMMMQQPFSQQDILLQANFQIENRFYTFAYIGMGGMQMMQEQQGTQQTGAQQAQPGFPQRQQQEQMGQQMQQQSGLVMAQEEWAFFLDEAETIMEQARFRFVHLAPEAPAVTLEFIPSQQGQQQTSQQQTGPQQTGQQQAGQQMIMSSPLNASQYMNLQPGTYRVIIRSSGQEGQQQQTGQQTEQAGQQTGQTGQQMRQQQMQPQQQEILTIDNLRLEAGNTYSLFAFGAQMEQQMQQETGQQQPAQQTGQQQATAQQETGQQITMMQQLNLVLKFDNFVLLRPDIQQGQQEQQGAQQTQQGAQQGTQQAQQ